VYAGLMLPDALLSLTMFASALLVFSAGEVTGRTRLLAAGMAGALAAASYSVKDTGLLIVPLSIAWLVWVDRARPAQAIRLVAVYAAAALSVVLLEMAAYRVLSGDALYRFHAISQVHNTTIEPARSVYEALRAGYWNLAEVMAPLSASSAVLLAGAVVWLVVLVRPERWAFFALSGGFLAAYLIFGTSSFTRWMPLPVQDRYFEPVVPFLALSAGVLVARLASRSGRLSTALALGLPFLIAVASLPSVVHNAGDIGISSLGRNSAIAIHSLFKTHPEANLYLTREMRFAIEPFVGQQVLSRIGTAPERGPLPVGYHMLHPWKNKPANSQLAADISALPVWLVVDEDHRRLSPIDGRTTAANAATTKAVLFVNTRDPTSAVVGRPNGAPPKRVGEGRP
jgi:hypothetical protein